MPDLPKNPKILKFERRVFCCVKFFFFFYHLFLLPCLKQIKFIRQAAEEYSTKVVIKISEKFWARQPALPRTVEKLNSFRAKYGNLELGLGI